jgi:hypothetical protein
MVSEGGEEQVVCGVCVAVEVRNVDWVGKNRFKISTVEKRSTNPQPYDA